MLVGSSPVKAGTSSRTLGILGAFVIGMTVLVVYQPIVNIGFFAEDYAWLDWAARLRLPDYLTLHFNQCVSAGFCRPAQALGLWIEYLALGNNAPAFRLVQLLIHLSNSVLLYLLVWRVTHNWKASLVAGLLYNGLPAITSAFFWFNISDQASTFYYLLSILAWVAYLEESRVRYWVVAMTGFILALLNKEVGVTVPVALFLADRWLVARPLSTDRMVRRYLPMALVLGVYGFFFVQRYATFTNPAYGGVYAGMGVGPNILTNLQYYLNVLGFPWQIDQPAGPMGLLLVALGMVYLLGIRRDARVALVGVLALLPLLPVLLFTFAGNRYLYMSLMGTAVLLAAVGVAALRRVDVSPVARAVGALIIITVIITSATAQAEAFDGMAGYTRELRVPVRSIFQQHVRFDDDTYVYFVNAPIVSDILSGMFAVRYGANVTVGGTDYARAAELRRHTTSYVYTFDPGSPAVEQRVTGPSTVRSNPGLPAAFTAPLRLEGYEVVNENVTYGGSLVVLLYWRAVRWIDKDYTLYAHLLDAAGNTVAGSDSQPRAGQAPTTTWQPDHLMVDWVVLPVGDSIPAGKGYRLEIGWYDLPTMERLSIVDAAGQSITDHVALEPFVIGN